MILNYILLAHCISLLYCTIFYWPTAYPYGILLFSTGPQPIPMVHYYHLLVHWPIPMVLNYHLLAPCLSLWYSSTFYWLPDYTDGTLLPSTYSLPIHMSLYYLLLAPCLSLWYPSSFNWPTAYPYGTILPSIDPLHIPMILYYRFLTPCLSLWYFATFF